LLGSLFAQTVPVEILVMDDNESQATSDMLAREFPAVKLHRIGSGRGPAFQRNHGIRLATHPIVFPVDDDTLFVSPRTVEQTLAEFDHPRIAAVAIPFINVRQNQTVQQIAHGPGFQVVHAFVGASHAVCRDAFLKVGGYREHFFYMGEEGDICLRLMRAGYVTRLGRADAIHHLESTQRNLSRAGFCGRRNDILFCWHNVPMPVFPLHLAGTTVKGLFSAAGSKYYWPMLKGMTSGFVSCFRRFGERRPVPLSVYRLHRSLKKQGARLHSEIEPWLPTLETPRHGF
jgi:glycosyltransferase involved in cell wall biosynthesis